MSATYIIFIVVTGVSMLFADSYLRSWQAHLYSFDIKCFI